MAPKSYALKFKAGANGRVGPADVFALRKDTEDVIISRRGNLLDEGDLNKIIRAVAQAVGESEEEVRAYLVPEWNKALTELLRAQKAEAGKLPPGPPLVPDRRTTAAELLAATPQPVKDEAMQLLRDPRLVKKTVADVAAVGVAGEKKLTACLYLVGTSRKLKRPLSAIVQGPSSSGKSYGIEKTASLMPPEETIFATQMTPQALFHMPPGALQNVFIVAGERSRRDDDEQAEATRALREMLSAGRLSKWMPVKVEGGRIETKLIEQEGPVAYVESTTLTKIFDEDANRSLLLNTDERREQTEAIVTKLSAHYAGNGFGPDVGRITARHHTLQRLLEPLAVVIPFAESVGEEFNTERVEVRRAFPQLMSMVEASALLHQFQRKRDPDGRVVATADDYQLAYELLAKPMCRVLGGGVSDPTQRFYDRLRERVGTADVFSTSEAKRDEPNSRSSVYGWLSELHDAGFVEMVSESKGKKPATWKLTDKAATADELSPLPAPATVFPEIDWTLGRKTQFFDE
jgi:hypothetical protein